MSRLTDLLRSIESTDPKTAADLRKEIAALTHNQRTFGLVYEKHQPEAVRLPGIKIRKGSKVHILPKRGSTAKGSKDLWRVESIDWRNPEQPIAHLVAINPAIDNPQDLPRTESSVEDLVTVAEFHDRIYPGLVETGRVERGGDAPFHSVINAENFHALEMLTYTHRHSVDAIYIDPPYNTGAKEWKYNNDYVDEEDAYRHSKWLSFMERRLKLAKELLNPADSVLIVTIDAKEYLRLGLLLEQVFPECNIQMISNLINPKGVAKKQEFYRVDEYIYFVYLGNAEIQKTTDPMIHRGQDESYKNVQWKNLIGVGADAYRVNHQDQFYPIFLDEITGDLHSIGDPLLPVTRSREEVVAPEGTVAIWPIRKDGSEGRWMVGASSLRKLFTVKEKSKKVRWGNLLRSGTDAYRTDRKNQFYPIFLDEITGDLHSIGDPLLPVTRSREEIVAPEGTVAIWPIRKDGSEGRWMVGASSLRKLFAEGYATVGKYSPGRSSVSFKYVTEKLFQQIDSGIISIARKDNNNTVILEYSDQNNLSNNPKTMWNKTSHSASEYGSSLMREITPGRKFPFPKSLYAVEDTLRFFVLHKPQAIILDFFAGSGTTAHAVMRLNKQDGGKRKAILVTNNEVSADEQESLVQKNLRPGEAEWEQFGICDYVTKPRITSAITGKTPEGVPIKGDYKFTDEFPMSEGFEANAVFFTLTYESPMQIRHNRAFKKIAPLLWLRAGSQGRIIESLGENGWDIADNYAVIENLNQLTDFSQKLRKHPVNTVFVVTDDNASFEMAVRAIPETTDVVRLYSSYLENFEINSGRSV